MGVELNHIIIPAKDKRASAEFLAAILGLEAGPEWSIFVPVRTSNGVTLDDPKTAQTAPAWSCDGYAVNGAIDPADDI